MSSQKEISKVITIVKKEVRKFDTPIVTEISSNGTPYQVLISCLLSLRTRDVTTAKATKKLFSLADTPQKMVKLSKKQIENAIYPVGFYHIKAKRIKDISKTLIDNYDSKVPDSIDELLTLTGVGQKTANIVIVYGFNKPGMPIDIHCHRIPNRLGWIKTKTPEQTERELRILIPKRYWLDFNNTFVTFGQNICKPVRPLCDRCPVSKYCRHYKTIYLKAE